MASELPKFLRCDPAEKPPFGPITAASDSLGLAAMTPADALPPSLGAGGPPKAASIFHSLRPTLIVPRPERGAAPDAPSAALARAKSQAATERVLRTSRPVTAKPEQRQSRVAEIVAPPPEFRIVSLPRLTAGSRWRTEAMRSYSVPMLLWITKGQGRITLAGVTRGFGPHNCIFMPPATMHGIEITGPIYGSAVYFPRGCDLALPDEPVHLRLRDAAGHNELTQMIDVLQRELDGSRPARERALAHHAGLLSVWLERQIETQGGNSALSETGARRLSAAYSALVEKRFREGLSVGDLAAELGVTPTHLTRACNEACGHSAHEILSDRIFYEARKELAEARTPIHEIARDLGFTSAAYFTRAFQKATGQTPTAFRAASN